MRALILGAGGQVGRALAAALPDADALDRQTIDIGDPGRAGVDWSVYDTVINAAAYTDVDGAETPHGRPAAWRVNAVGPAALALLARRHRFTLVHLSSEYVFDGRRGEPYDEAQPLAPLSAYGASKAAGDLAVYGLPRYYLVRPTWLVGEGRNFVRTMMALAARGVQPAVVSDQLGRLTFADDLAAAILDLVNSGAAAGTYHITNTGEPVPWSEIARSTFVLTGSSPAITAVTTAEYFSDKPASAPRPLNSVLNLSKAAAVGIRLPDWRERLAAYVAHEQGRL